MAADEFWCLAECNEAALGPHMPLGIYVTAYRRPAALACLIASLQAQTERAFHVVVLHDGPDQDMLRLLRKLAAETTLSFEFRFSRIRHNDYGHSLRHEATQLCRNEYLLLTNDDNYYVPKFVELMLNPLQANDLDFVMCNMVHSHERQEGTYVPFTTRPQLGFADIGCFIARAALAKQVGFRDRTHDGDATYLADMLAARGEAARWGKLNKTLFVHN